MDTIIVPRKCFKCQNYNEFTCDDLCAEAIENCKFHEPLDKLVRQGEAKPGPFSRYRRPLARKKLKQELAGKATGHSVWRPSLTIPVPDRIFG